MNILIIENVSMGYHSYNRFDKLLLTTFSILPTLSARRLAALTPQPHKVTVINERYTPIDYTGSYDLVVIDYTTSTAAHAYEIADRFRTQRTPVVLSGMHASLVPQEAILHADSVLIGRQPDSWLKLLQDIQNHTLQPFYKPGYTTASLHPPPLSLYLPGLVITGAIEATTGCPYHCEFCPEATSSWGGTYTERPIDDVIDEIKHLPQKTFMFYDASLTINPAYTKELFKKMKGLHKKFFCNGNADVLATDNELVRLSNEAGCVSWLIGFESVSQHTIDAIHKTTNTVANYKQAVDNIHTNHMAVVGDFIFGFDTDTPKVFSETLRTIQDLGVDVADFCILTPLPGTPLYERFNHEERILTTDWTKYTLKTVVYQPKNLTPKQLTNGVKTMYTEFYSPLLTVQRLVKSLRLGFYPFLLVFTRNLIALMNARRLK